jgi:hypothetical protein
MFAQIKLCCVELDDLQAILACVLAAQYMDHVTVELHGRDAAPAGEQRVGERSKPRTELDDLLPQLRDRIGDPCDGARLDQEVLGKGALRLQLILS